LHPSWNEFCIKGNNFALEEFINSSLMVCKHICNLTFKDFENTIKLKIMKKTVGIFVAGVLSLIVMTSTTCSVETTEASKEKVAHNASVTAPAESDGIIFDQIRLEKAKKQAKKEGKMIFIDCYTSWCGPCKRMAATTFKEDEVAKLFNSNFINLKIDIEKDEDGADVARRYRVRAYPTLLIINGDGELVKQTVGFQTKDKLMAFAKSVL
jgi:thiol:disulfide interchange protein